MVDNRPSLHSLTSWKISLISLILAIICIISALLIGLNVYEYSFKNAKKRYQEFYLRTASMIIDLAENRSKKLNADLAESIKTIWESFPGKPADEYICIVDPNANLLLHTATPQTIGNYCGTNQIFPNHSGQPGTLLDLVEQQRNYAGDYISSAGKRQLATFVAIPNKKWVFGLHRSQDALDSEIENDLRHLKDAFLVICLALMPLSFSLLFWTFYHVQNKRKQAEQEKENLILNLQKTLAEVKSLSGLLPICAHCKKIRDDKGYWNQIETYIKNHSKADFTHSICPACAKDLYPEEYRNVFDK